MENALVQVSADEIVNKVSECAKQLSPEDVNRITSRMQNDFPAICSEMNDILKWKTDYDAKNSFQRWWNNGDLEEKKEQTIFLLARTSTMQLDAIHVLLQLSFLLGQMQVQLKEQQNIIMNQQREQKQLVIRLQEQTETISSQQRALSEQNEKIISFDNLFSDNADNWKQLAIILDNMKSAIRNLEKEVADKIVAIKCEMEKTICTLQKDIDKKIAKSIDDTLNELSLSAQTITWEN